MSRRAKQGRQDGGHEEQAPQLPGLGVPLVGDQVDDGADQRERVGQVGVDHVAIVAAERLRAADAANTWLLTFHAYSRKRIVYWHRGNVASAIDRLLHEIDDRACRFPVGTAFAIAACPTKEERLYTERQMFKALQHALQSGAPLVNVCARCRSLTYVRQRSCYCSKDCRNAHRVELLSEEPRWHDHIRETGAT